MNATARTLLPPQAAGQPAWRVLDTGFDAARLYTLWQGWRSDVQAPRVLHIVTLIAQAPDARTVQAAATAEQAALAEELLVQWTGLLPGMHRLSLAQGRLQLTLGIGELQPLLRELQFEADTVCLDGPQPWDRYSLKALARCCRRGTQLAWDALTPDLHKLLPENGWVLEPDQARYDPPWELKTSRETLRTEAAAPGSCVVVGAGLAGASVAAALARRGWQVTVLDAAPEPAAGASGLPAGLLVPHVSTDDSPRSRLSRAGLRLTFKRPAVCSSPGRTGPPAACWNSASMATPGSLPIGPPPGKRSHVSPTLQTHPGARAWPTCRPCGTRKRPGSNPHAWCRPGSSTVG